MSKTFDFNSLQRPTLEVTLMDEARTKIRVTTPTEALFEKFLTMSREMPELSKKRDGSLIKSIFEVFADLFSCNMEGITFTAEDLRDKYGLKLEHLICFQPTYLDFINEIQNAKN